MDQAVPRISGCPWKRAIISLNMQTMSSRVAPFEIKLQRPSFSSKGKTSSRKPVCRSFPLRSPLKISSIPLRQGVHLGVVIRLDWRVTKLMRHAAALSLFFSARRKPNRGHN